MRCLIVITEACQDNNVLPYPFTTAYLCIVFINVKHSSLERVIARRTHYARKCENLFADIQMSWGAGSRGFSFGMLQEVISGLEKPPPTTGSVVGSRRECSILLRPYETKARQCACWAVPLLKRRINSARCDPITWKFEIQILDVKLNLNKPSNVLLQRVISRYCQNFTVYSVY